MRIPWNKGIKTGLVPRSAFKKGCQPSEETLEKRRIKRAGYRHSEETRAKMRVSQQAKNWVRPSGAAHYNWKGGVNYRDKHSLCNPDYREWRKSVFARDTHKCRIADENCDGMLQAHHILRWSEFPELRYQINNGITLCQAHHPRKRAEEKRLEPMFRELVSVSN